MATDMVRMDGMQGAKGEKKYELVTEASIVHTFIRLYRIRACKTFHTVRGEVREGDLGGLIESEENLSQDGSAWIFDEAKVYGKAFVGNDACIGDCSEVFDLAKVLGHACVENEAKVYGSAVVSQNAYIGEYAEVFGEATIFGNATVSQDGKVYGSGRVHGKAKILGAAEVFEEASVYENAVVSVACLFHGSARAFGNAAIAGVIDISGTIDFFGDTKLHGEGRIMDATQGGFI